MMTDKLPPLPAHVDKGIESGDDPRYTCVMTADEAREYGRQCWNAAIEAAENLAHEERDKWGEWAEWRIRALKLPT